MILKILGRVKFILCELYHVWRELMMLVDGQAQLNKYHCPQAGNDHVGRFSTSFHGKQTNACNSSTLVMLRGAVSP